MHKPADAGARVKPGVIALTALAMLCFAANSLLCRLALHDPSIDPASFTAIRILAGAATLAVLVAVRQRDAPRNLTTAGTWSGAAALFIYAAGFSFAYVSLGASVGALVLFGCVQTTMIAVGVARGERMAPLQITGALLAIAGLVYLLSPGLSAPPLVGAALMATAGVAWGIYSLIGRSARNKERDPTLVTAGNFLRAAPMTLLLLPLIPLSISAHGAALAMASGAIASGIGYAIWYTALKSLRASEAAIVQLTVPVIAAAGGALLLSEALTLRLFIAGITILGGVAIVLTARRA
ncbi:MAG: DMT family transporter [Hyphomonadaceae bacterium]